MLKRSLVIIFCLLAVLLASASIGAAGPVVLRWGHCQPVGHPATAASQMVAKLVAERTNNQVRIEVYPASQLGSAQDQIQGLLMGTQDMAYDGPGVMSKFMPKIAALEAPFLYKDYAHMRRVLASSVVRDLYSDLQRATGINIVDTWYYGARHITTSKKPVRSLADIKGLKLRVPEIPAYLETLKALGASPTPMPFGELYLALQTGVVDGQENPIATIDSGKLYEVQKYLAFTGHITNLQFVMISDRALKKLTASQQKILKQAILEAGKVQDKTILDSEDQLLENFRKAGMQTNDVNRDELRTATKSVYEKFANIWGEITIKKLTSIK